MISALDIQSGDKVLEIGTGRGYAAAVLGLLCEKVFSIERIDALAQQAKTTLDRLGYNNVEVITGDGSLGWPTAAPYNGIVAAASAPHVPDILKAQLAVNGRLVMPVGVTHLSQSLVCITRISDDDYRTKKLLDVRFVPMLGAEGWHLPTSKYDNVE